MQSIKKILSSLGLVCMGVFAHAQGLENVVVEKYYVSDANDAAGSEGVLPVGSVTYRIFLDLAPGYKFQALYGSPVSPNTGFHELKLNTTTSFFNNEDRGATTPNGISVTNVRRNTVMLDSWFSVGATANGKVGVVKTDDTDGALANSSSPQVLQNADASAGIPIKTQDGMITGTAEAVTFVGLTTELDVFDATSQAGNSFLTSNGAISALNGATGPTAANRVLIGQFTTDGTFCYELNIQIGTPSGGTENYVSKNADASKGEILFPALMGCSGATNTPPTVNITNPADGASFITGASVAIDATAADSDGSVTSVEFFVDGVSVGTDNSAPYAANYTAVSGSHTLTAKATDNAGAQTTSSQITINVSNDPAPVVTITSPANGATFTNGDNVTINATATDNGTVTQVEFFVDNVSVGVDNSAPYSANYVITSGSHTIIAKGTDNGGAVGTSASVIISSQANIPPSVAITAPANGANYTAPAVVTINASASDAAPGTVANVEFFVNGVSIGTDATAPYTIDWVSTIGVKQLTAKATDNQGAVTTSAAVTIDVADPNALPYKIATLSNTCVDEEFCLPIIAVDSVANIIGYDIIINYDKIKVHPHDIVIGNALIDPSYVSYTANVIDSLSQIRIAVSLNGSAPSSTQFKGKGEILCIEFHKEPAFQSVDTAHFSVSKLQESYANGVATKLVEPGSYITYKDSLFHGKLTFWTNNSPIQYNSANPNQFLITNIYGSDVNCVSTTGPAVQPDLNGEFTYTILHGEKIKVQRDIAPTTDVVTVINSVDALMGNQLLVHNLTFTPSIFQAIALDVNADGVISAGDISQINQRSLGALTEFKQKWNHDASGNSNGQPSKDWLFLDTTLLASPAYKISGTYPNDDGTGFSIDRVPVVPFCLNVPVIDAANCPVISLGTYKGVLLGDVNGNYDAIPADGEIKKTISSGSMTFDLANAIISNGFVDVPVYFTSTDKVEAIDFVTKFNQSVLEYSSVIPNKKVSYHTNAEGFFKKDDGTARFTCNSIQQAYEANQEFVSIRFKMLSNLVSNSDLLPKLGLLQGNSADLKVTGTVIVTGIDNINSDHMISVYPNPANEVLNITAAENANVQIRDMEGRLVMDEVRVNANERYELNVQSLANGVYMMQVYNNNFITTQRVMISKH